MKRLFAAIRLLACLLLLTKTALAAASEETVTLASGTAITSHRYADHQATVAGPPQDCCAPPRGADAKRPGAVTPAGAVVLWLTGQYGRLEEEHRAAAHLAERGFEVWLTDWLAPYFLPQVAGSVTQVPDTDLAEWLEHMSKRHAGRPLVLVASGRATTLALRAAVARQALLGAPPPVAGAVLLWPLLYQDPEPGEEPQYDPVVGQTRLDLVLLVPMSSAGYWWREAMQARFESAGSRVRIAVLPGLRDRFYHRGDANAQEQAEGTRLGEILAPHIASLSKETQP